MDSVEDAEYVLFPQDEILLVVDLDLAAGVLAEQDPIARLDVERDLLAVIGHLAGADRDDLALLGLLLRGVRNDDAAAPDFFFLDALDQDAVMERAKLRLGSGGHAVTSSSSGPSVWMVGCRPAFRQGTTVRLALNRGEC